ncbi:LysR family transcriptional regulator [soil metagenome]
MNASTRQLRAFLALVRLRHFTRAAAETGLSQPAFSALIRSLEASVGARLFDRDTRKVELTVEGRGFAEAAERLLRGFDDAIDGLQDQVQKRRGRVAMAVLPALAAGWLPSVLAQFRAEHPGIELDVADVLSDECVARVKSGAADFALAAIRADTPDLMTELFCSDRFHLVCRREHRLAAKPRISLKDLAGEPFVHLARSSSVRHHMDAAVFPALMNGVMELEQLSTVAGMVRAGLGISAVPTLTLFHFDHPELVTRPITAKGLQRDIFVIRPRDRSASVAAAALLATFERHKPSVRRR